jgi:hypothetical protein
MLWEGQVTFIWENKGVCRVLVAKPDGRRPLGKTKEQMGR